MSNIELLIPTLERLIGTKRPHGGRGEGAAILLMYDLAPAGARCFIDTAGNLHVDLRDNKAHRTLFVAHVDTVHREDGPNAFILATDGMYFASGAPLGADDGAGCAILACLMQSVPAYYLFCRGEERGGVGSSSVATNFPKMLAQFDRAIAFDRRGGSDVITYQSCGRCCSDTFGEALSTALNDEGLLYMPCDGGVYTDTAEFTDIIPECTNISCGYLNEHSDKEQLDGAYLKLLAQAALNIAWDSLPTERDPTLVEEDFFSALTRYPHAIPTKLDGWKQKIPQSTDWEDELEEAFGEALDGNPDCLMRIVAKEMNTTTLRLDPTLFEPQEIAWYVDSKECWDDVLYELIDNIEVVH